MAENTRLEILLLHDQWIVCAGLVAITGLAWIYLLNGAGMVMSPFEMTTLSLFPHKNAGMPMNMPEMNMIAGTWSLNQWIIFFMMWWIMMIAMMVPSAAPMILLYARVVRFAQKKDQITHITIPTMAFVFGYLTLWLIFSIIATTLQWVLEQNNWLSIKMITNNGWLSGSLLIAVGIYQLTPLKLACLKYCRSPAEFIASHMKNGRWGAFQMGIEHGIFCVGCCWLLMILLFVGGVMNLLWIAILTFFVLSEKVLPQGQMISRFTGYVLIVWGTAILIATL
jgi:predicted metal-binding membrane protein